MILKLNKEELKKVERLILEKNMNIASADDLFNFCFYSSLNKFDTKNYLNSVFNYLELNADDKEDKYYFDSRIKPSIKLISPDKYLNNHYVKSIKPLPYRGKGYELGYLKVKPYQALPYDDIEIKNDYIEVSKIGYFDKEYSYLAIMKDDVVWMSLDPNEINTMEESIKESKGRVLAFGLGLGYYPIEALFNDKVSSVTVIEKDKKIIEIFNKHIAPLIKNNKKLTIINDDAFHYLKNNDVDSLFDYLFIDIWHNPEDGLPLYLQFKKLLKNKKVKTSYWLEKSILAMYRRCLLTIVEEAKEGYTKKDYLKSENEYDQIINELYFKTENIVIKSYDELLNLLQDKNLLRII